MVMGGKLMTETVGEEGGLRSMKEAVVWASGQGGQADDRDCGLE